ncbi:hypothetical protein QKF57_12515 [Clavibacter michiganensis]|uniref:hypothetical protein n=1 Tax=Clavibacter michiganensis TaxID=28447 RepID=UPI0026DABAD6|nr:hypothetical protein [Clavibacter michiganensis]MDO4026920.1 hypothetical protein [Clavibacter michiganensis]MDO4036242.1 hypothetical protein [Clavibacter michiganensis]MDO4048412.1 hypothetical protein [Clavibacter michiganensis]MDO4106882.1 hypothetical protein [Clavibacter michiganensis]MDO4131886.1 hypothetical protein [Clavibacter michiganensis]
MTTDEVPRPRTLEETLSYMHELYSTDPMKAVRGQHFIKALHGYIARELNSRLHPDAVRAGVYVKEEAAILGSHKSKDVDVAVMHPTSGPLMLVGVRSQMSSVGKNVLTYYQDIVGEAVSLQERYPMTIHSYVYLHPLSSEEKKEATKTLPERAITVSTNVDRYSKMYRAITGRDDKFYRVLSGIYDQFAYMVVDFTQSPAQLRDDLVKSAVSDTDLSIETFVDRLVATYKRRNIWFDLFI